MDDLGPDDDMRIFGRGLRRRLAPMRNGGFSTTPKAQLAQALVAGDFGPGAVKAEDQWADEGSLLNLVSRMAAIRLAHPGIGRRECRPIGDAPDSVIALRYAAADHDLVVIHNLSAKAARLDLDLGASCRSEGAALLGDPLSTDNGHLKVTLPAHDFRWSKWPR